MALSNAAVNWLAARELEVELADRMGWESVTRNGDEWLKIPYVAGGAVVNHKYRCLADKAHSQDKDAVKCFWNEDAVSDPNGPLVITEGEFDALAALQADFVRTLSVPDGAPAEAMGEGYDGAKYDYVERLVGRLKNKEKIILAVDNDGPGQNLLNDLADRLGRAKCWWVKYPKGCKDLNDVLMAFGIDMVRQVIDDARPMKIEGLYKLSELPPPRPVRCWDLGIEGLDEALRIRSGDFIVATGIPKHGKTVAVQNIICSLAERHGLRTALATFENKPQTDYKHALARWFNSRPWGEQPDEMRARAEEWIEKHFVFILPSLDDDPTIDWVLERAAAAILRHEADVVVIDPWNEMDHTKERGVSLTEYTGEAIKSFKRFAAKYDVPVIVVAHPTKLPRNKDGTFNVPSMYDISDSSHWYNKCDLGLVIHRTGTNWLWRIAAAKYQEDDTWNGRPGDVHMMLNAVTGHAVYDPRKEGS